MSFEEFEFNGELQANDVEIEIAQAKSIGVQKRIKKIKTQEVPKPLGN